MTPTPKGSMLAADELLSAVEELSKAFGTKVSSVCTCVDDLCQRLEELCVALGLACAERDRAQRAILGIVDEILHDDNVELPASVSAVYVAWQVAHQAAIVQALDRREALESES